MKLFPHLVPHFPFSIFNFPLSKFSTFHFPFSINLVFLLFALSVYSQTATVISENAKLRGTPSEKGKVVDTIKRDTQLEVIKQKDAWFLVQTREYVGWIHGNTIKLTVEGGNATVMEIGRASCRERV